MVATYAVPHNSIQCSREFTKGAQEVSCNVNDGIRSVSLLFVCRTCNYRVALFGMMLSVAREKLPIRKTVYAMHLRPVLVLFLEL